MSKEKGGDLSAYFGLKQSELAEELTDDAITDHVVGAEDPLKGQQANPCIRFITLREDKMYRPFFVMLDHGIPLASVWLRASLVPGLNPDLLLGDGNQSIVTYLCPRA